MKISLWTLAASKALAVVSLLPACSSDEGPAPESTGGVGPGLGGAAGFSAGGQPSTGGIGGFSAGGLNTAGGTGVGGASGSGVGGASGSDGTNPPATFETLKFIIDQAPCFGAGCHNDEQNPLNLMLDEQLYGRVTSRISTNCGNLPVVNPGKPQESALIKILRTPCGDTPRMPMGCVEDTDPACVPPEYITALEQWIAMGAPPQ